MNIVLFGPQGSGKGTQAVILEKRLKLYHLSMGDELRSEINKGTPLGKKIASIINKGNLVPDSITNKIILKIKKKAKNGIIFDGFPRRKSQLVWLIKNFKIDFAFELTLPLKDTIKRLSNRRVCTKCRRNYNLLTLKPKISGKCDDDGAQLIHREDDQPKEIKLRLKIYKEQTQPLRDYYGKKKFLHTLDGRDPIPRVNDDIVRIVNSQL